MTREDVVEVLAGAHEAVSREAGRLGPVDLQPHTAAHEAQPLVADPPLALGGRNAEQVEFLDGARREAVTADLLAREARLLQEQDVEARVREVRGHRRTAGAGADDDDVGALGCVCAVHTGARREVRGVAHAAPPLDFGWFFCPFAAAGFTAR